MVLREGDDHWTRKMLRHRRKLQVLGGAALVVAAGVGLSLYVSREGVLNSISFRRIKAGMHVSEVERLLGRPGSGPWGPLREVTGIDMLDTRNPREKKYREWRVGDQEISFCVIFDGSDRVVRKLDRSMPLDTPLQQFLELLEDRFGVRVTTY